MPEEANMAKLLYNNLATKGSTAEEVVIFLASRADQTVTHVELVEALGERKRSAIVSAISRLSKRAPDLIERKGRSAVRWNSEAAKGHYVPPAFPPPLERVEKPEPNMEPVAQLSAKTDKKYAMFQIMREKDTPEGVAYIGLDEDAGVFYRILPIQLDI
jgi:hypothetical protein